MGAPMEAGISPNLDLGANYILQFTALDASTGAEVTSVTVSNASLLVTNLGGVDLTPEVPDEVPLWIPIPADVLNAESGG